MAYCNQCGRENPASSKFCSQCGSPVESVSSTPTDRIDGTSAPRPTAGDVPALLGAQAGPKRPLIRRPFIWAAVFVAGLIVLSGVVNALRVNPATGTTTTNPLPPTTAAPVGPVTQFGDGTWIVGQDIAAGTYRTYGGSNCYWERDRDFSGGLNSIIANDNAAGPAIVTIRPTDRGFTTKSCGEWSPLPAHGPRATTIGQGTFAVGIDIASGTYSTAGGSNCYWERESGFLGSSSDSIIANDNPTGRAVVTIAPTDKGFKTTGCAIWTR